MIKIVSKTTKTCALCKNWNGSRGPLTLNKKSVSFFEIDSSEKQKCFLTGFTKQVWNTCNEFESRY